MLGSGSTMWWEKGAAPLWTHGGRQVKSILGQHGGPWPLTGCWWVEKYYSISTIQQVCRKNPPDILISFWRSLGSFSTQKQCNNVSKQQQCCLFFKFSPLNVLLCFECWKISIGCRNRRQRWKFWVKLGVGRLRWKSHFWLFIQLYWPWYGLMKRHL